MPKAAIVLAARVLAFGADSIYAKATKQEEAKPVGETPAGPSRAPATGCEAAWGFSAGPRPHPGHCTASRGPCKSGSAEAVGGVAYWPKEQTGGQVGDRRRSEGVRQAGGRAIAERRVGDCRRRARDAAALLPVCRFLTHWGRTAGAASEDCSQLEGIPNAESELRDFLIEHSPEPVPVGKACFLRYGRFAYGSDWFFEALEELRASRWVRRTRMPR
jgi:hypothetical protein